MNPLFCAILRFCTCKSLFKYLRSRYTKDQVSDLNNLIKLKGKLRSASGSLRFLRLCVEHRVIPKAIHERIVSSKLKHSPSIERTFLCDAIAKAKDRVSWLRTKYRQCWNLARRFVRFFDLLRLCRYIAEIDNRVSSSMLVKHQRNVDFLVRKRYGSHNISPDTVITNLSNHTLSDTEKFVLSHGLDFCVPNRSPKAELVLAEFESLLSQLDKQVPTSPGDKEALVARLCDMAHAFSGTPVDSKDFVFHREHFNTIKTLRANRNLIITKPDKGSGVVILDKCDYIAKMNAILQDTQKFQVLGPVDDHDHTSRNEAKLQRYLLDLKKQNYISQATYDDVRPSGSSRPRMYGLPKIHKVGTPLRPILSMVNSAQHALAKWLASLLQPVLDEYSSFCIKDSFTFSDQIKSLDSQENMFMGSFDICSLFTNVPLQETIEICANYLYRDPDSESTPLLPRNHFVNLLHWATSSVEFSFNDTMYRQHDGIAMGSPLGPILANIFVGFHEQQLFQSHPHPVVYYRYVDDIFALFSSQENFNNFLPRLNGLHPSLSFTSESEVDGKLPFLDVLVDRSNSSFSTSVYRKPSFSGLYTRWDSFCPTTRKINLIKTLTLRAVRICSPEKLDPEITSIKSIFTNNGYPEHVTNKAIAQVLHSQSMEPEMGPARRPVYVRLPWIGPVSKRFEKQIKQTVQRCFPQTQPRVIFRTSTLLPSTHKDVLPTHTLNNVIYHFKCTQCEADYVGRTSLRLMDRVKQHVPASLLRKIAEGQTSLCTPSSIAQHLIERPGCATKFGLENFSILARAHNSYQLHILEAVFIKRRAPSLCKQKDLLFKLRL